LPTWSSHNCEGASNGTLQSLSLSLFLSGNLGIRYMGDVLLLGFTLNADTIGDIPYTAAMDPENF